MRIKFNENNRLFNIEFRMEEFEIFHNICKTAPIMYILVHLQCFIILLKYIYFSSFFYLLLLNLHNFK